MIISLNGDPYELAAPLTVTALLEHLKIDPRRVAVEHNLTVLKRATFDTTVDPRRRPGRDRQLRRRRLTACHSAKVLSAPRCPRGTEAPPNRHLATGT